MESLPVSNDTLQIWFNEYLDMNNPKIILMGNSFNPSHVLKLDTELYDFEFNQWLEMEINCDNLLQDDQGNIYEPL